MRKEYYGLFEDELMELFREMCPGDVVLFRRVSYTPACMICDDGVYTSGAGYFLTIDQRGARSHVSRSAMVERLAHERFCIDWRREQ